MANVNNNIVSSSFIKLPEIKYYDLYTGTDVKQNTILGDATFETLRWYNDADKFSETWLLRHGTGASSGIFYILGYPGAADNDAGFRVTLIQE